MTALAQVPAPRRHVQDQRARLEDGGHRGRAGCAPAAAGAPAQPHVPRRSNSSPGAGLEAATGVQSTRVKLPICASWGELYRLCAYVWVQVGASDMHSSSTLASGLRPLVRGAAGRAPARGILVAADHAPAAGPALPADRARHAAQESAPAAVPGALPAPAGGMWVPSTVVLVHQEETDNV